MKLMFWTWTDAQLVECEKMAAKSLIDLGEPGDVEDVIRRAEHDAILRARLEGAAIGIKAMFEVVREGVVAVGRAHRRSSSPPYLPAEALGAEYVERNAWAMFDTLPLLQEQCGQGAGEVLVQADSVDALRTLGYVSSAAPRASQELAAAMRPALLALATESSGGCAGAWVSRASASALASFVFRSAPSTRSAVDQTCSARLVAGRLRQHLHLTDAEPVGPEVTAKFNGPQLYEVSRIIMRARVVRPWKVMDSLAISWAEVRRPKTCTKESTAVAMGERFGGSLTMPSGSAAWLRDALTMQSLKHARKMSCGAAAAAISAAIDTVRAKRGGEE